MEVSKEDGLKLRRISPAYSIETLEFCLITVLEKGKSFPYTIPVHCDAERLSGKKMALLNI